MKRMLLMIGCVLAATSCRDKDDKKDRDSDLSQLVCTKEGVYCYSTKKGFGFAKSVCKDDGGSIGMVCDPNPVVTCENDVRVINLYGDQFKDVSCDDVGLPIENQNKAPLGAFIKSLDLLRSKLRWHIF